MIKRFKMTDEEFKEILDACKPVPYMVVGGIPPTSPQENVNRVWQSLGQKLGFQWDTARPVSGESNKVFEAEAINAD